MSFNPAYQAHKQLLVSRNINNSARWRMGERLDHLFEARCDTFSEEGNASHLAVFSDEAKLSYAKLDQRANQLARYLIKQGVRSGDRVGLLLNKSAHTYITLLAVLKINAAYVPLDASFPGDRISYITNDANIQVILTLSNYEDRLNQLDTPLINVEHPVIEDESVERLSEIEKGTPLSQLCYIIYTSGTTGNPKGVAIDHSSICNFVRVASEVYGLRKEDRMYQGLTIAFDFSVEEIWVSLIVGATLAPGKSDANLVGEDLAEFLIEKEVTAFCCVPTLLASIEEDIPNLKYLLVSGEACPQDLVKRWHQPDRRFINAYGPTEATVTATITTLHPDKQVTIGSPLPTYTVLILDANENDLIEKGGVGEICIAGIGLANGYLNRPDLTEKAFIPDFIGIENNPSSRIYRTGDLGRINDKDEIEYLGRIDTQVKIRGYRIELTEIESVLLQIPQIAQAVVDTYEQTPGAVELVAYYSLKQGFDAPPHDQLQDKLREYLPGYMVPAFFEQLPSIPMTSSHKADRKNLPAPTDSRVRSSTNLHIPPATEMETFVATALSSVLKIEDISAEDNFFDDLGAHSLLMAQFSAKLRDHDSNPSVSMREIYQNPTVRQLAVILESEGHRKTEKTINEPYLKPSKLAYYSCGAAQILYYYTLFFLYLSVAVTGFIWAFSETSILNIYIRLTIFSASTFLFFTLLPIAMKWILIGRWKKERIPVWSLKYFRFWVVKHLVQTNPILMFKGLPIYNYYLRIMGAKIGKHVVIQSARIPVCTDLIEIGDGSILRKDSILSGYKAQSGYIYTGAVKIGSNSFVGEASLLDINTCMGNDTQLGHASSLQSGQCIPAGKKYHGSPAVETESSYCSVKSIPCTTARRFIYTAINIGLLISILPIIVFSLYLIYPDFFTKTSSYLSTTDITRVSDIMRTGIINYISIHKFWFVISLLATVSLALFTALLVIRFLFIIALPRLLNIFITEGVSYPLYGLHYYLYKVISRTSNSYFFNLLFGDSSYILFYLNAVGFRASKAQQSGSNFGQSQKHDVPFLCSTGAGTMVSDGLAMINTNMSNNAFCLSQTAIGENCFLGNNIHYPPNARLGNNCLLATKVLIPVDGPLRENTGILGSPSFEIPRSSDLDDAIETYEEPNRRQQRIHKKNAYNLYTISSFLFFHWFFTFLSVAYFYVTLLTFERLGSFPALAQLIAFPMIGIAYFILVEKSSLGFKRLKPRKCSIYDRNFWKVEHYWKHAHAPIMGLFKGTPFKNIITRLLGVKIGKMVFDDGAFATEKTMLKIGDYCTLNDAATLQCHSLEDGIFKSDYIKIGNGCSIGCNAYVHYDVALEDNVILNPDSFLMKGERIKSNLTWQGNPARET